ncbi:MAG: rRNA maturation RNase YbeY [Methylococcaceae bacterium]|nr:MAG: rRNA maturation RNase YbeY [Methylococcaceae bacterium]
MIDVEVQLASANAGIPDEAQLCAWAKAAVQGRRAQAELVIRVVDEAESAELNGAYRGKHQPTNVLSFPFEVPPGVPCDHLGDLVVCAPVVEREALEQHKTLDAHWAHMLVHGVLHLLGYDHVDDEQATTMETEEIRILQSLGYLDPYAESRREAE